MGVHNIFTKLIANRLQKSLPMIVHTIKYGFVARMNILHNILNLQIFMNYVNKFNYELIIVQIDLEKVRDLALSGWTSHMDLVVCLRLLPIGDALRLRNIVTCTCFFYTIVVDHS